MPAAYFYSSTAGSYVLTGAVTNSSTILVLNTVTGLPTSVPFKVVIEPGQPTEEIVKVNAVAGTSLTVDRGWDGSSAVAHAAAVEVRHMMTAEDLSLSRAHEAANAAHGATGAVVGTTNAQQLTNKDLSSGTNSFPPTLATTATTQTLSNKTLSGAVNTFSNIPQSAVTGLTTDLSNRSQGRQVLRALNMSVPSSTFTPVTSYSSTPYVVGSLPLSVATDTSAVLTPSVTGLYRWEASVNWVAFAGSSVGPGRRRAYIKVDGVEVDEGKDDDMLSPGQSLNSDYAQTSGGFVSLTAGQQVGLWLFHSSGVGPLTVSRVTFSLVKVA